MPPAIQCSTGPFWAYELDHALDLIAEAGFTDIELMVTRDRRTHEPALPLRLASERGLNIASVHGPFLAITKTVWGPDPLGKIRRGVEMCREVGATNYVVHPPFLWERAYARWVEEECAAVSESSGVAVAVETMYPMWVAGRRMRAYRWLDPAALARAAPLVAMDTSHLTVARHDILDAYQVLAPKLVHIHLSQNAGDGRDGHLELEQGILPLDRFLAEVGRSRYAGVISLELSLRRYLERPKELVKMLRRSKELVEAKVAPRQRRTKGMPRT
ncbi:MAG TPA: sugar phosphate isomerase/epimerase family protein [Actinomycetota bacterium]|nr:sugar phosphate isomerase/epimerase family protein [Actinomycetota bacterium]